jgi:hypothetical protein
MFDHCPHRVARWGLLQQLARHFNTHPFDRGGNQHIPDILGRVFMGLHVELKMLLQGATNDFVHFTGFQLLVFQFPGRIVFSHLNLLWLVCSPIAWFKVAFLATLLPVISIY